MGRKSITGLRLQNDQDIANLRWDWECRLPELGPDVFVFAIPVTKNGQSKLLVPNSEARAAVNTCRGAHPERVFTWRDKPIASLLNNGWLKAREKAVQAYQERLGRPCPQGFRTLHAHDLRHTAGRRLRAAGVDLETRKDLFGHKAGDVTTFYSMAEIG